MGSRQEGQHHYHYINQHCHSPMGPRREVELNYYDNSFSKHMD